jgi:AraC-like DNA-binding protein
MDLTIPGRSSGVRQALRGGTGGQDRIRIASGADGVERLEAHLRGPAFAPHRHDTYAIGVTLAGVQTFGFRGEQWHCLPGQVHILHPDELHDGRAGTDDGFGYRIAYVDPALIHDALGGEPLPFVAEPVLDMARLQDLRAADIWDLDIDIDEITRVELVVAVADLLVGVASRRARASGTLAVGGLRRVRDLIVAAPAERHSMDELERLAGVDRWTLARQFRDAFGTSPSRFRTLRRLDHVRGLLRHGRPLAEVANEAGFSDQSHMSRQFKRAYGMSPARWAAVLAT